MKGSRKAEDGLKAHGTKSKLSGPQFSLSKSWWCTCSSSVRGLPRILETTARWARVPRLREFLRLEVYMRYPFLLRLQPFCGRQEGMIASLPPTIMVLNDLVQSNMGLKINLDKSIT